MLGMVASCATAGGPAYARDNGQWKDADPATTQFYQNLMQPDHDSSCCGPADAYWADETDYDAAGNLVAIITDTRDDAALGRVHIDVGTRIVIPKSKIRKVATPNPTGHNVVFIGLVEDYNSYYVYCWEPRPLI